MTIKLNKMSRDLYHFNTQDHLPTSAQRGYAETDYLASRYGTGSTWLVSSSLDPLVLVSEHLTLTALKEHYAP